MKHLFFAIQMALCIFFCVGCAIFEDNYLPIFFSQPELIDCISEDDSEGLEQMLEQGISLNKYYEIYYASYNLWNDGISIKRRLKRTLLLHALSEEATNCVKLLLDRKANVKKTDSLGENALMYMALMAESAVDYDIAERIYNLGKFDIDAVSWDNYSALSYAIKADNLSYVKWLLQKGADYNAMNGEDTRFNALRVPIWFDAVNANWEIFDLFMELPKIDFNSVDRDGNGVLHYLYIWLSDYDIRFKRLIEKGATLNKENNEGYTIMFQNMRMYHDCKERISMLCEYVTEKEDLEKALEYAKILKYTECAEVLENYLKKEERN